jgi:hypothetical protein
MFCYSPAGVSVVIENITPDEMCTDIQSPSPRDWTKVM